MIDPLSMGQEWNIPLYSTIQRLSTDSKWFQGSLFAQMQRASELNSMS
jgi:hypothetical protein